MATRRIFNPDESSPDLNLSVARKVTPSKRGIHPALIDSLTPQGSVQPKPTGNTKDANPQEQAKKSIPASEDSESGSESEVAGVPEFFSCVNQKIPYTKEEDEVILQYVLKGQNIFKVSSILLWKHLEAKKDNPKRTYQSLKNRFLRNIKPCLFTTYGYLVKDKTTTERILAKFPELKHQIGRKDTLSNIRLPERKPPQKASEQGRVSSTSDTESHAAGPPFRQPEERIQADSPLHFEPTTLNSASFKSVLHPRIIQVKSDGITISVNFKEQKVVDTPQLRIYDSFQKLERKNKLVFCYACGRYNIPRKVSPLKCSRDADNFIPNSVDTPGTPLKIPKGRNFVNSAGEKKKTNSASNSCSPCSPSLLSDAVEDGKSQKSIPDTAEEGGEVQAAEVSNSVRSKKSAKGNNNRAKSNSVTPLKKSATPVAAKSTNKTPRVTQSSRNSTTGRKGKESKRRRLPSEQGSSSNKAHSENRKRTRDSDEDVDAICDVATKNLRDLIDTDEEKDLARKCLNIHLKSMGIEEPKDSNWDSYFLESSSDMDMETPPLTIDYESDPNNVETEVDSTDDETEAEKQSQKKSGSCLARNMKKMLGGKKKS